MLYVADPTNYVVRALFSIEGPEQSVLAGNGGKGIEGDGGDPQLAQLSGPYAVAPDTITGDVYIADTFANQVRRVHQVDRGLAIERVAGLGTGAFGSSGDGGPATDAGLSSPFGIARDAPRGITYVADTLASRVRAIRNGNIALVAGLAGLNRPRGLAVDGSGVLYVADTGNNVVRRFDPATGSVTTFGTGVPGDSGDGGPATAARLHEPAAVALSPDGKTLFIADTDNNRIRRVSLSPNPAASTIDAFAGSGGAASSLSSPFAVAVLSDGRVAIGDTGNNLIKVVGTDGIISTLAGDGLPSFGSTLDQLSGPTAVTQGTPLPSLRSRACGSPGDSRLLLTLDTFNHGLRAQCSPSNRALSEVLGDGRPGAGPTQLAYPMGLAVGGPARNGEASVYIADTFNDVVRRLDTSGTGFTATVVAGTMGVVGFAGDHGPAVAAKLSHPGGVAVDAAGNLYIADTYNDRIRRVDPAGTIITIAGTGVSGSEGDGGPATAANLFFPQGVAVDGRGNVYVADTFSHKVRRIDGTTGIMTTVAGTGQSGFTDGPATAARFDRPWSVSVDDTPAGPVGTVVYVADQGGHRVRAVVGGAVRTIANTAGQRGLAGDEGPAEQAKVDGPRGVSAVAGTGDLLLADTFNNRVRLVSAGLLTLTPPLAGPDPIGAIQQLTARLVGHSGSPIRGQAVAFRISGANPQTATVFTDDQGMATLSYAGAGAGTDAVEASVTGGSQVLRATSTVLWIAPKAEVTTTPVQGTFFARSDNTFTARPGDRPAFSQTFPNIEFDPPADVVRGQPEGLGPGTRPFTDVTTGTTGAFSGTIQARTRDDAERAGVGDLRRFDAEFTASFVVARAGDVTFQVIANDGFLLGVGGRATRVSGTYENAPADNRSPFQGYGLVGASNQPGQAAPSSFPVTVHFPAPGTYPYELDYFSCCGDQLSLSVNVVKFREETSSLSVYLGYADDLRPSSTAFPLPWQGSPGVAFIGHDGPGQDTDAGAIRFDNSSDQPITLDRVTVDVGTATFDLWGSPIVVAPHGITILTQTNGENFDTSDVPASCMTSIVRPLLHITQGGITTTIEDSNQVLNTGGRDPGCGGENESAPWQRAGNVPITPIDTPLLPTVLLSLLPNTPVFPSGTEVLPELDLTVSALDGSWEPAASLPVTVIVSGPNAQQLFGTTGLDGVAHLGYRGTTAGNDLVQATATISDLSTVSNELSVGWFFTPK